MIISFTLPFHSSSRVRAFFRRLMSTLSKSKILLTDQSDKHEILNSPYIPRNQGSPLTAWSSVTACGGDTPHIVDIIGKRLWKRPVLPLGRQWEDKYDIHPSAERQTLTTWDIYFIAWKRNGSNGKSELYCAMFFLHVMLLCWKSLASFSRCFVWQLDHPHLYIT